MSIRHFRIFIAVAEEENITKAAKKLYLTQPTVSVAIKEIEEHYAARFFERINQRLRITEEGKRFLDYAKHFIAMYDEMEIAFKNADFTGRLLPPDSIQNTSPDVIFYTLFAYRAIR